MALQFGASLIAIIALAGLAHWMKLGGDVRIRDEDHAREIAGEIIYGFEAAEVARDRAGIGALLVDGEGRQLLIRRHGAQWAGRLLDASINARLDQHLLTIGTSEKSFGSITLNLGPDAQYWAAGLRHLRT